jgi:hypothetical protein
MAPLNVRNVRRWKIVGIGLAVLLVLYALSGFVLAPWLVKRFMPSYLEQRLERQVSFGDVNVNPFLLTVAAHDLTLEGKHGSPALSVDRAFADLALSGVFRGAWTFDNVLMEGLHVHLVLEKDKRLNLLELAKRFGRQSPPPENEPATVVIHSLAVPDARLTFTDLTGDKPANLTMPISLQASSLSSSAERAKHELKAALPDGGALEWRGEIIVQPAVKATGEVQVRGLRAAALWPFLRDELRLSRLQGTADFAGRYAYDAATSLCLEEVAVDVADVQLVYAEEKTPILAAKRITASGGKLDLAQQKFSADALNFAAAELTVAFAPDGQLNWSGMVAPAQTGTQKADAGLVAAGPQKSWQLEVAALGLDKVAFTYLDRHRRQPLALHIGKVGANLKLALSTGPAMQVVATEVDARLASANAQAPGAEDPALTASLRNGSFNLQDRLIAAQELSVHGGRVSVVRQPGGEVALLSLLGIGMADGDNARAAEEAEQTGRPWRYGIAAVNVNAVDIALADRSFKPALAYDLQVQSATAKNFASAGQATFEATLSAAAGGTLRASGTAKPDPLSVHAQVQADRLGLTPLQPLLERYAALDLRSGVIAADAQLCYPCGEAHSLKANGDLQVASLLVNEQRSGDRFLAWKQLDATGIGFDLGSMELAVKDVTVTAPGAKIAISKDRKVNLMQMIRRGDQAGTGQGRAGAERTGSSPFKFRIERVRLHRGEIDYADLSLVLPFSTRVMQVEGTMTGISNNASRRAAIKADGAIEPYGSASVEGSLVPFDPARFTDLRVVFNNVLVPPLSPYTATFAGRKVDKGKLWLDLGYKVENGKLLGNNDIRLANFSLGERVVAPSAINLPLDLAVAMLTNSQGVINLSVPVRGDLDKASFSVSSAVRQALGNVLQRIVAAPFRAIGRLFGGNEESLAAIDFSPGSAQLRAEQREKLDALTRALHERPQLQLVVSAPYDPQADARALQRERARRELALNLGRTLAPGEDPGPIAYDDPATQRALVRMARAQPTGAVAQGSEAYKALFEKIVAERTLEPSDTRILAVKRSRAIAGYLVQHGIERERVQTGEIAAVRSSAGNNAVSAQLQVAASGSHG